MPFTYNKANAAEDLSVLRQTVQSYSKSGEVLFIYQRQLLTFGMIPNVKMVPEDEVVSLMEMAISGNKPYLNKFYADLASHRFAAIVASRQNLGVETGDFIEESNVWTKLVAQPLLCQYKPAVTLTFSNIQVFVPRAQTLHGFSAVVGTALRTRSIGYFVRTLQLCQPPLQLRDEFATRLCRSRRVFNPA